MQKKDSNNINQELIDKIINVAYGDAGFIDRLYVLWKVALNRELKNLYNEYKSTAKAINKVKPEDVPLQLVQSIKNKTMGEDRAGFYTRPTFSLVYFLFGKKAIPATVLGLIVLIVVTFFVFKEPIPSHKYSKAEIELAEKQFKQTLAIVGKAFERAEKSFSNDILDKQINKELNKGYYLVNNILIGG